eukprot:438737-Amphidinium_carterae.1
MASEDWMVALGLDAIPPFHARRTLLVGECVRDLELLLGDVNSRRNGAECYAGGMFGTQCLQDYLA